MQKTDARKLSSEVQQHNREQAIRLHLQGMKRQDIAHIVGIHTSTLGAWIALYNKGGAEALKLGQRGRRKGDGRTLSAPQEKRLKEMMVGQCPDQMELPFALWSSTAIGALIHSLWGIKMGQRTISDYMRRWGYTPQKAAKRAYERSDKATQEWLNDIYPAIKQRATQCDTEILTRHENTELMSGTWKCRRRALARSQTLEMSKNSYIFASISRVDNKIRRMRYFIARLIFWGDETGISNQCQHVRGYAPRGQIPVIKTPSKRLRSNLISAVNHQGK